MAPHVFPPDRMARLLSPEREARVRPEELLRRLGLAPGQVFVDIGCGPGFFTLPAARIVGPQGLVWALDIQPVMLAAVQERAAASGAHHVRTVLSREDALPLEDRSADFVLIANVLHEVPQPEDLLREAARILRPEALLAVIEWQPNFQGFGPPAHERLAPERVRSWLGRVGLDSGEAEPLGAESYLMVARPLGGRG